MKAAPLARVAFWVMVLVFTSCWLRWRTAWPMWHAARRRSSSRGGTPAHGEEELIRRPVAVTHGRGRSRAERAAGGGRLRAGLERHVRGCGRGHHDHGRVRRARRRPRAVGHDGSDDGRGALVRGVLLHSPGPKINSGGSNTGGCTSYDKCSGRPGFVRAFRGELPRTRAKNAGERRARRAAFSPGCPPCGRRPVLAALAGFR